MTAFDLVDDIFRRAQAGMPANERVVTQAQLGYLRALIGREEEDNQLRHDGPFVEVWAPRGRKRYLLREDPGGRRSTITRFESLTANAGMLF
jgi:hypothetical protein